MCITFFKIFDKKSEFQLILCFNHDERFNRVNLPFDLFQQDPNIYAGRDVSSQGTWLGLNIKTGILVALTNHISKQIQPQPISRGLLTYELLKTSTFSNTTNGNQIDNQLQIILNKLETTCKNYSPFNLIVYNIRTMMCYYINNIDCRLEFLSPSSYGLANLSLQNDVVKVQYGMQFFQQIMNSNLQQNVLLKQLQKMMKDETIIDDVMLPPSICYPKKQQKQLRGTKQTTLILIRQNKEIIVKEITYNYQEDIKNIELSLIQ